MISISKDITFSVLGYGNLSIENLKFLIVNKEVLNMIQKSVMYSVHNGDYLENNCAAFITSMQSYACTPYTAVLYVVYRFVNKPPITSILSINQTY